MNNHSENFYLLKKNYSNQNLLYLLIAITLLTSSPIFSATSLMEEKLLFEKAIQERAEKIVEKITGSKDMVVLTNVELAYEEPKEGEKQDFLGARRAEEDYLPGITYSYVPFDTYNIGQQNVITKRITILITLPINTPENIVERVKKETNELLGLNPLRGDTVQVAKITFTKETKKLADYFTDYSQHIYWMFMMLLLTLFLFGPLRHFFKTIVKAMELRIEADTRIRGGAELTGAGLGGGAAGLPLGGPIELTLDRRRPQLKEGDQTQMKRFGFINENNLKNLIYLVKKEPPETIAVVISYLPQTMASQILTSLPPATQAKVAMNLATVKILDPSEVDVIEKDIKTKIDYLLGGEDSFMQILDSVDRETQENILKTLETENPTLAVKLKSQLFFFEDLILLDKPSILKVIRECQRRQVSLALALKNSPEDIKVKIMDALTEGARAMLAEQIDLLGEVSEKRISEERKLIEAAVKDLEKNGDIVIDRTKKVSKENTPGGGTTARGGISDSGYDIVTRK